MSVNMNVVNMSKYEDYHQLLSDLEFLNKNLLSIIEFKYKRCSADSPVGKAMKVIKDSYGEKSSIVYSTNELYYNLIVCKGWLIHNFIDEGDINKLRSTIRNEKIKKVING